MYSGTQVAQQSIHVFKKKEKRNNKIKKIEPMQCNVPSQCRFANGDHQSIIRELLVELFLLDPLEPPRTNQIGKWNDGQMSSVRFFKDN